MTAIALGKTINGTFGVIDAMVQVDTNIRNYRDCRLQDKITAIESSNQFLLLCGEEIIANGALFIESWSTMKKVKLDLFKEDNFKKLLISCDRYRQYSIDVQKQQLISQDATHVYIIDKINIREYTVKHDGKFYFIEKTYDFKDCEQILNYKGNISKIQVDPKDVVSSAILKIGNEHENRKRTGITTGKKPLQYEFMGRFSAVFFENAELTERKYPFNELTDQFLSYGNDWDYIESDNFKYSPEIG
jgi:hypothetical protein